MAPPVKSCNFGTNHCIKEKECYWIPHPSKVYKMVLVEQIEGEVCVVTTTDENTEMELDIPDCPFYPVNPCSVDDMTALHHLHEAGILSNLEERSKVHNQQPYTYVANVLIAVNPLRKVPDYAIEKYLGTSISAVPPHPYGIAEMAFRQMILPKISHRNQSIVISGESGAGKTETAKIVLKYLCWRSGHLQQMPPGSCGHDMPSSSSWGHSAKTQHLKGEKSLDNALLQSNPILESFGNAKTQRNNNSSRFGKFLKLQFDEANNFRMVAAGIDTYLLEKSRVVSVTEGERNYHVFYELLGGVNPTLKKKWRLKNAKNYRYLTMSSEVEIEGVDNKANFSLLRQALSFVGIGANIEQDCLFRTLSGILSLGNAEFDEEPDESGHECAYITESYLTDRVSELFGVDRSVLEQTLITKYLNLDNTSTRSQKRFSAIRTPRNAVQAAYSRDSMSKSVYQRAFDWIVSRISESLNHQSDDLSLPFIGVLDIFGFEDFSSNGLEQLLINYANEALQLIYSKEVLVEEHRLFLEEGLQDVYIGDSFHSNEGCIDLIGRGSQSIISYLDSVCVRPGIDEEVFTSLLHTNISNNPFFPAPKNIDKKEKFKVKHYARVVTYTVGTFITRNMDVRLPELEEVLFSSSHNTKCGLFFDVTSPPPVIPVEAPDATDYHSDSENDLSQSTGRDHRTGSMSRVDFIKQKFKESELSPSSGSPPRPASMTFSPSDLERAGVMMLNSPTGSSGTATPPSGRAGAKRAYTVAGSFVRSMHGLTKTLSATKCSFIRCIKPNATMTPGRFEAPYVVEQLRCLGVVQTCEVLKAGMPTRIKIADLEGMYRPLLPDKLQTILRHISEYGFVRAVMWAFQIPVDSYKIGRTRVFFRVGKIALLSELTAVDMESERGAWLASRLRTYVMRIYWRRVLVKVLCDRTFVDLLYSSRLRIRSVTLIQRKYRSVMQSDRRVRQKYLRRKWRVAILAVRIQLILVTDYQLIKESNAMRIAAEEAAEESIRKMEALEEQFELTEQEEEAEAEAERHSLGITDRPAGISEDGVAVDGVCEDDEGPYPLTRRRSASSVQHAMNKVKTEMQALVAASSLATVSVCLFRWTKIKLFMAFETWTEVALPSRYHKRSRQLSSMRRGNDNMSSVNDDEASMHVTEREKSKPVCAGDSAKARPSGIAVGTVKTSTSAPALSTSASVDGPNGTSSSVSKSPGRSRTRTRSSSGGCRSDVLTKVPGPGSKVKSTGAVAGVASGKALLVSSGSGEQDASPDGMCFECEQREAAVYCATCTVDYCKVCTQFVHDCCKVMKSHIPMPLPDKKGYLAKLRKAADKAKAAAAAAANGQELPEEEWASEIDSDDDSDYDSGDAHVTTGMMGLRPRNSDGEAVVQIRRRKSLMEKRREGRHSAEAAGIRMGMTRGHGEDGKAKDPCAIKSCTQEATKGVSIRFCEEHYEEFRSSMKGGVSGGGGGGEDGENDAKTLQQQVALLKKQLQESGQQPVEFVELHVARERMQQAVQKLMGGDEAAEKDIERWDKAIRMNPDYQKEMEEKSKQWEIDQQPINHSCLLKMRTLIPPNVASTSMTQMMADGLPKSIANRIWTKKCLWIINTHPEDTKRVHIADLQTKYGNQGLDIVEMRAIWDNMPAEFDNDGDGKKAQWRALFRQKLEELTVKEAANRLSNMEKRNPAYKGHDDVSIYDSNVEIERAAIQKSTAFDATEKPDVGSSLGDGIKNLKMQMAAAEKPCIDGPLVHLAGGSGDVEGGKKMWVTMLLNKKTLCVFEKQSDAEADAPVPVQEFIFQSAHSVKVGPGSRTFCIMDGETEVLAFQSEKSRREAWVTAANDIVKLAQSTKKIKVVKQAAATPSVQADAASTGTEEAPRPKPSFLAGISGGLKKRGGSGPMESGGDAGASAKPSFLGAIAARKMGGNETEDAPAKPSFLDAIAARKKATPATAPASDGGAGTTTSTGGGGCSFLEGNAAGKKAAPNDLPAATPLDTISAPSIDAPPPASSAHNSSAEVTPAVVSKVKKERKVRTGDI